MSAKERWFAGSLAVGAVLATVLLIAAYPANGARPIEWLHDEARAVELSRKIGKPLLVDFRADWCSACKMLDADTWPDPAVRAEVEAQYVPLQIDMTANDEATRRIAERYEVVGLPTILAGNRRIDGFVRPAALLEMLRRR